MRITISESQLFKNLVEIQSDDTYIDLHNDYQCTQFEYRKNDNIIVVTFLNEDATKKKKQVELVFSDVEVVIMSLALQRRLENAITIDNFYRGRFEKNGTLYEHSSNGKAYYYLEFDEGHKVELFADNIDAFIT